MSSLDLELDAKPDDLDEEPGVALLERRWFAVLAATRSLQAECAVLHAASQLAEAAWRRSRTQLAEFEALRDALERQLPAMTSASGILPSDAPGGDVRGRAEFSSEFRGADKHRRAARAVQSAETAGP
jgi:hypothetical protein